MSGKIIERNIMNEPVKYIIDAESGAIEQPIYEGDSFRIISRKQKNSYHQLMKKHTELSDIFDCYLGSFYFNNYVELLKSINNDYALAFRFIYLCTYINYEGELLFGMGNAYMTEKDLMEVLRMKHSMTSKVKKLLLDYELISIDKETKHIKVNTKYCNRGVFTSKDYKDQSTRVFDDGIQKLYKSSMVTEHKKLGIVISLLPYMNIQFNIICHNPKEKIMTNIIPLSSREICEITDYSSQYYSKLIDVLTTTTVNDKPLVMYTKAGDVESYIINPSIFYRGSNIENLKYLVNLFELDINIP